MALQVKTNFIIEDITDEEGNKIGVIKFNPKDSRIMNKLAIILKEIGEAANNVSKIDVKDVPEGKIDSLEDFEKFSDICNSYVEVTDIQNNVTKKVISDLIEIFGEETIECFTQGTNDMESILPLIEYVLPYVKDYKNEKVNSYLNASKNDVME